MAVSLLSNLDAQRTRAQSGAAATSKGGDVASLAGRGVGGPLGSGEDIEALWRRRAELAKGIVDAAAPTIQDVLMKVGMTASLLSEGELWVGLTPQCLEECDRALAREGDAERCLKALEPKLWALCQRVQEQTAALEARWDCVDESEEAGGSNDPGDDLSLATAWGELHKSVWSVARYETMTAVGLRAKGKMFSELLAFFSAMDGLFALQDLYLRDLRSPGLSSSLRQRFPHASPFCRLIGKEFSFAPDPLKRRASDDLEVSAYAQTFPVCDERQSRGAFNTGVRRS